MSRSALSDRPRDLLVAGHVNIDRFLRVASFPGPDRTVPVESGRVELGGTAALLALTAAARGVRVGIAARVGAEFPAAFETKLRRSGVDLRGLERVPRQPSPTCYIVEDRSGGQRTFIDQGPMGDVRGAKVGGSWLRDYAWLHLSTGDPGLYLRLAARARASGLRIALDPAQEIFYRWSAVRFRAALGHAEMLFGNRAEVDRAAGFVGARGAAGLVDHVPLVVRTEGPAGATAFSRVGTEHVPSPKPRSIRTLVGAGDSFRGGFYGAWFQGQTLRSCLRAGASAAVRRIEGRR